LRCQQCNIIYANADQSELNTEQSIKVIENLSKIGTNVLLFTGGEPFLRNDLHLLVKNALKLGIHPRIQTNGHATEHDLNAVAQAGSNDISISLDSLEGSQQDFLNGNLENSWRRAIKTISKVSQIFPRNTFAVIGCVLSPYNIDESSGICDKNWLVDFYSPSAFDSKT
jgi:MoaA/NifB/PqqE/SkfB family radical SAM enzyme